LFYGSKADVASMALLLVSVLFSLCRYTNLIDVDHGEEFMSQNGGKQVTGTKSKHSDISRIDLPMDADDTQEW
jgi:hypothetical protein